MSPGKRVVDVQAIEVLLTTLSSSNICIQEVAQSSKSLNKYG